MKSISVNESIDIQKELLSKFHIICENNNIKYSLAYGTLLGAVRHNDIIPWDDDIDVCVTRKDFRRLEEIFSDSGNERYVFVSFNTDNKYKTKIGYFMDRNTCSSFNGNLKEEIGIHLDVYPVDIVSLNTIRNPIFNIKRKIYQTIIRGTSVHPELRRGFKKKIISITKKICLLYGEDRAIRNLLTLCKKESQCKEERNYAAVLVENGKIRYFDENVIHERVLYKFGNNNYYGYSDYDSCLKAWYGDYMKLPPEKDRVRVTSSVVNYYWKEQ